MMFADDLVLFAEASEKQMQKVMDCLQKFEDMSGNKLSKEKTSIFFSPNTHIREVKAICSLNGFKQVPDLGRYLGANIVHPK